MSISGRGGPRRSRGAFRPLALALLLIETGCTSVAKFPGIPLSTLEFHIDFGGTYFPYGTYDFDWTSSCVEDCPPNQEVRCFGTLDSIELATNAVGSGQQGYGEVVRLNAVRSDYPDKIACQPEADLAQGLWQYQLVVTGGPNDEPVVNSACAGKIFAGENVVKHTALAGSEIHNQCAPVMGGAPPQ